MFGFLKKTSKIDLLKKQYAEAMKNWHKYSSIDRKSSDKFYAEAADLADQIDDLKNQ